MIERIDPDSPNAPRWISVMESLPPAGIGRFLVTNRIDGRNGYGRMSHVWLASSIEEPLSHDIWMRGYTAMTEDGLIRGVTHWALDPKDPTNRAGKKGATQ